MKPRERWLRVVDAETYALIVPGGVVLRYANNDADAMTYVPMPGSAADLFVTSRLYVPDDAFKPKVTETGLAPFGGLPATKKEQKP